MKEVYVENILLNDVKKKRFVLNVRINLVNKYVCINECIIKICDIVDNRYR